VGWTKGDAPPEVFGVVPKGAELARDEGDAEAITRAEAIVLLKDSADALEKGGDALAGKIAEAVRAGAGLVVAGRAAAFAGSESWGKLLARRDDSPPPGAVGPADDAALEVLDQSHPITQCVTHLRIEGRIWARAGRGTSVLASWRRVRGEAEPVLWTRTERSGRIAVLAFEPEAPGAGTERSSASARERTAVSFLIARAIEWCAQRAVAVQVPAEMPLAAERLAPSDAGSLPGLAAAEGFFRGREIAPVMGYPGASWLERAERESTEEPEKVLDALAIKEGWTVADVGAGTGYFTIRLSRRVGASGKVIATDIQAEMIDLLKARLAKEKAANVETLLATETDLRLPEGAVDLAIMVDVYHELAKPSRALEGLLRSLRAKSDARQAGRLVLIEYRGEDPAVPIKPLHRTTVQQMRAELEPAGFRFVETKEFLLHQHVLVFERK
jgi:SAM-dependent methyltransferase